MTREQIALLPCPFCGGAPTVSKRQDEDLWTHNVVWWHCVRCSDCDVIFDRPETADESATDRWNKRAPALTLHQRPETAQQHTADQRQKIAEALVESYYGGAQTWNFSNEYTRDTFLRLADAALTALQRQPTVKAIKRSLVRQTILRHGRAPVGALIAEIEKLPILDALPVIADIRKEEPDGR